MRKGRNTRGAISRFALRFSFFSSTVADVFRLFECFLIEDNKRGYHRSGNGQGKHSSRSGNSTLSQGKFTSSRKVRKSEILEYKIIIFSLLLYILRTQIMSY